MFKNTKAYLKSWTDYLIPKSTKQLKDYGDDYEYSHYQKYPKSPNMKQTPRLSPYDIQYNSLLIDDLDDLEDDPISLDRSSPIPIPKPPKKYQH